MPRYYGIPRPEDEIDNNSAVERFRLEVLATSGTLDAHEQGRRPVMLSELFKVQFEMHDWAMFWAGRDPENPMWLRMARTIEADLEPALQRAQAVIDSKSAALEQYQRRKSLRVVKGGAEDDGEEG